LIIENRSKVDNRVLFFQEKGVIPRKGVSKANYGGRGFAAQTSDLFYFKQITRK
jgi:hypothetical protein